MTKIPQPGEHNDPGCYYLNEPDDEHHLEIPTRIDFTGIEEAVFTTPEHADQWDARLWDE